MSQEAMRTRKRTLGVSEIKAIIVFKDGVGLKNNAALAQVRQEFFLFLAICRDMPIYDGGWVPSPVSIRHSPIQKPGQD